MGLILQPNIYIFESYKNLLNTSNRVSIQDQYIWYSHIITLVLHLGRYQSTSALFSREIKMRKIIRELM